MSARHALAADLPAIERSLALAFDDDPMIHWVFADVPDAERLERTAAGFFRPSLAAGIIRGHLYTVGDGAGASLWAAPDVRIFRDDEGTAFAAAMIDQVGHEAFGRLATIGELVASHHPHTPHFYLFILGAAEQGRGHGAQLVAPVLDRCDEQGLPAYLESSNARNLSFYERHGFRVVWEDRPGPDGPLFHGMWRDPR